MQTTTGTSRWFRFNLWLHRWTSLIATIPFLILCLTGTVLIFHEEIDYALGVVPASESAADAPQKALGHAVDVALKAFPNERVLSIGVDPVDHPGVQLLITAPLADKGFDNAQLRFADLVTGELIGESDPDKTLTGFLLELHAQWFLGPVGELIGALIALLVLLSLLSGLVVYASYLKRIVFGVLRRGRGPRLMQLDLHNFIGAIVLGWAVIVTVSGFLLGFATIALGVWQMTALGELRASAAQMAPVDPLRPPVDVDRAYAVASAAAPHGWRVGNVMFPDTEFSTPRHYTALLNGIDGIEKRMLRVIIVDAQTGEIAAAPEMPGYLTAIFLSQPLHFGDYGGLPLKLLWTACTWLILFITINGAWLWWDRRRRTGGSVGASA